MHHYCHPHSLQEAQLNVEKPLWGISCSHLQQGVTHWYYQYNCDSVPWEFFLFSLWNLLHAPLLNPYYHGFVAFGMGQWKCIQLVAAARWAAMIFGDDKVGHARHMVMITPKAFPQNCGKISSISQFPIKLTAFFHSQ